MLDFSIAATAFSAKFGLGILLRSHPCGKKIVVDAINVVLGLVIFDLEV